MGSSWAVTCLNFFSGFILSYEHGLAFLGCLSSILYFPFITQQGTFTAVFCYGRTDHRTRAFAQFPLLAFKRVYAYFLGSFTRLGREPHWTKKKGSEEGREGRKFYLETTPRAPVVVQWLRVQLTVQGTVVQSLVREDPRCRGAIELQCAMAIEPVLSSPWSTRRGAATGRSPRTRTGEEPCSSQLEKAHM